MGLPADFGILGLSFVLFGSQSAFIDVYTALLVTNAALLAAKMPSWFREMQTIDAYS